MRGSKQKLGKYSLYLFASINLQREGRLANLGVLVMNPRITWSPSGDCSESLSYLIFQERRGKVDFYS